MCSGHGGCFCPSASSWHSWLGCWAGIPPFCPCSGLPKFCLGSRCFPPLCGVAACGFIVCVRTSHALVADHPELVYPYPFVASPCVATKCHSLLVAGMIRHVAYCAWEAALHYYVLLALFCCGEGSAWIGIFLVGYVAFLLWPWTAASLHFVWQGFLVSWGCVSTDRFTCLFPFGHVVTALVLWATCGFQSTCFVLLNLFPLCARRGLGSVCGSLSGCLASPSPFRVPVGGWWCDL